MNDDRIKFKLRKCDLVLKYTIDCTNAPTSNTRMSRLSKIAEHSLILISKSNSQFFEFNIIVLLCANIVVNIVFS